MMHSRKMTGAIFLHFLLHIALHQGAALGSWLDTLKVDIRSLLSEGQPRPSTAKPHRYDLYSGPPRVLLGIQDTETLVGRVFSFKIPSSAFGGNITGYKSHEVGKTTLPSWLYFNETCSTFSGLPLATDQGPVHIQVSAEQRDGIAGSFVCASTSFLLQVHLLESDLTSHRLLYSGALGTYPGTLPQPLHGHDNTQKTCHVFEERVEASVILNADIKELSAGERVELAQRWAEFVSISVAAVTVSNRRNSVVQRLMDISVLAAGPGQADLRASKPGVELTWTIGCGQFKHLKDFVTIIEHNIKSGRVRQETGYHVIGWKVTRMAVPEELKKLVRIKRQVGGFSTPVPTPTVMSSLPTKLASTSLISETTIASTSTFSSEFVTSSSSIIISKSSSSSVVATSSVLSTMQTSTAESSAVISRTSLPSSQPTSLEDSTSLLPSSTLFPSSSPGVTTRLPSSSVIQSSSAEVTPSLESTIVTASITDSSASLFSSTSLPSAATSAVSSERISSSDFSSTVPSSQPVSLTSSPILTSSLLSSSSLVLSSPVMPASSTTLATTTPASTPLESPSGLFSSVLATSTFSISTVLSSMLSSLVTSLETSPSSMTSTPVTTSPGLTSSETLTPSTAMSDGSTSVTLFSTTLIPTSYFSSSVAPSSYVSTETSVASPTSSLRSATTIIISSDSSSSEVSSSSVFATSSQVPSSSMTVILPDTSSPTPSSISSPVPSTSFEQSSGASSLYSSLFTSLEPSSTFIQTETSSLYTTILPTPAISSVSSTTVSSDVIESTSLVGASSPFDSFRTSMYSSIVPTTHQSTAVPVTSTLLLSLSDVLSSMASSRESSIISSSSSSVLSSSVVPSTSMYSSSISSMVSSSTSSMGSSGGGDAGDGGSFTLGLSSFSAASSMAESSSITSTPTLSTSATTLSKIFSTLSVGFSTLTTRYPTFSTRLSTILVESSNLSTGFSTLLVGSSTPLLGSSTLLVGSSTPLVGSSTLLVGSSTSLVGSSTLLVGSSTLTPGFSALPSSSMLFTDSMPSSALVTAGLTSSVPSSMHVSTTRGSPGLSSFLPTPTTSLVMSSSLAPGPQPPILLNPLDVVKVKVGHYFSVQVPADTFYDYRDGHTPNLNLALTTTNHKPVSVASWIQLNTSSQVIYGLPLRENLPPEGTKQTYILVATNSLGLPARDAIQVDFDISPVQDVSFFFTVEVDRNFTGFNTDIANLIGLVTRLGLYYGDGDPRFVTTLTLTSGSTVLSWSNSTVSKTQCQNDTINTLYAQLVTADGKLNSRFVSALSPDYPVTKATLTPAGVCVGIVSTTPFGSIVVQPVVHTDIWLATVLPACLVAVLLIIIGIVIVLYRRKRYAGKFLLREEKPIYVTKRKPTFLPDELAMQEFPRKKKPLVLLPDDEEPIVKARGPSKQPLPPPYMIPVDDDFDDYFDRPDNETPPPAYFASPAENRPPPPMYRLPPPYVSNPDMSQI